MTMEWTEASLHQAARQMMLGLAAALPAEEAAPTPVLTEDLRLLSCRAARKQVWRRLGQRAAMIALTAALTFGAVLAVSPQARAAVGGWLFVLTENRALYRFFAGGDLTEEEITGRADIDPAQMYGGMTAEPNTKVEYDLHGSIQNVYYLGGFGEYQLSDPTKAPYLLIPLWMKGNSAVAYDGTQRLTITAGGFLKPEEIAGRQDIADAGGMDAVHLASEPNIRAVYGADGHLQTIYRIAADGGETACDPSDWPLAEMS